MTNEKFPHRPEGVDVENDPVVGQHADASQPLHDAGETTRLHATPSSFETVSHTVVKTKTKKIPVFIAALAGVLVGAIVVFALGMSGAFNTPVGSVAQIEGDGGTQSIQIDPEDTTLAEVVAAKALPSVVSITTTTSATDAGASQASAEQSGSVGSGVVLDTEGNIITNYHVVEGANAIAVSVGGDSYEATLVGSDPSSDLAVIKIEDIDSSQLTPIELGNSDDISVGEWVMAIGSPFGNEQSVSTGIVSALYRSTALPSTSGTSIYANMIQTDAAINPGNSGGALVNSEGELIGINSVIESYSGSSSGVGFAIPVNYAVNIASQIIDGKTPVHPYLGLTLSSVNATIARRENLPVSEGALVVKVEEDGPAASAGVQVGDIVTAIDGDQINSADGLIIALREHEVDGKVTLTVVNGDGEEREVDVTLGSDEKLQAGTQDEGDSSGEAGSAEQGNPSNDEMLRLLEEYLNQQQGR